MYTYVTYVSGCEKNNCTAVFVEDEDGTRMRGRGAGRVEGDMMIHAAFVRGYLSGLCT